MSAKRSIGLLLTAALFALVTGVFAQDNTQAWLRVAHLVNDGAAVDVWVDGKVAFENVAVNSISTYMAVDAGTHSIAVSPTGKGAGEAIIPATDETITAGDNYTLAVIGQVADKDVAPLLIDETETFKGMDTETTSPSIIINNLSGKQSVDVIADDQTFISDIAPGSYGAATFPTKNFNNFAVTAAGDPKTQLFATPIFFEPSVRYIVGITGNYPGDIGKDYNFVYPEGVTPRNTIDFLKGFSGLDIGFVNFPKEVELPFDKQHFNFDTLLKAIDAAGLTDMLQSATPYTLFAPTDDAFAALPAGTLDSWMKDPAALKNLLQYHVVDGSMSMGDLLGAGMVTTVQGGKLDFSPLSGEPDAFAINGGVAGCGCNYQTSNGYVFVLDHVLTPASS